MLLVFFVDFVLSMGGCMFWIVFLMVIDVMFISRKALFESKSVSREGFSRRVIIFVNGVFKCGKYVFFLFFIV